MITGIYGCIQSLNCHDKVYMHTFVSLLFTKVTEHLGAFLAKLRGHSYLLARQRFVSYICRHICIFAIEIEYVINNVVFDRSFVTVVSYIHGMNNEAK